MIVPGTASQSLGAALAATLDEPLAPVEVERFPDGELIARVPASADRAVIVATTDSATAHVELLQLQDAVRDADEVVTILPYMGYARQDAAFAPGDPVSARAVASALSSATDRVILVNPHTTAVCEFFAAPATAVDAAPRLADPLPTDLVDPVFLAPDESAAGLAESVRGSYGRGTVDAFEKTRLSGTDVETRPGDVSVADRDVVLVDDIVSTGVTMCETIEHLQANDVARVFVTCIHPLFAGTARTRLARTGVTDVYGTDTLERPESAVSVAPLLAREL